MSHVISHVAGGRAFLASRFLDHPNRHSPATNQNHTRVFWKEFWAHAWNVRVETLLEKSGPTLRHAHKK